MKTNQPKQSVEEILASMILNRFNGQTDPVIIAVGGPGGTGKSRLSRKLAGLLPDTAVLGLDHYKMPRSVRAELGIFGPHPLANEMELIEEHLAMIKSGLAIDHPVYNSTIGRADKTHHFPLHKFTIVDGEVSTYPEFRRLVDFSIFINADLETQKNTRLTRDIQDRGYSLDKAMATFYGSNIREFMEYGMPTREWADIVLFCRPDYSLTFEALEDLSEPAF